VAGVHGRATRAGPLIAKLNRPNRLRGGAGACGRLGGGGEELFVESLRDRRGEGGEKGGSFFFAGTYGQKRARLTW